MGTLINHLLALKRAVIPATFEGMNLLTGEKLKIIFPNKRSFNGLAFLADRYFDCQVLYDNMNSLSETDEYPQEYEIDKSVILVMHYAEDNGLGNYGCNDVLNQLSDHRCKVLNEEGSVYDNINNTEATEGD